jgi:hypothetical protein
MQALFLSRACVSTEDRLMGSPDPETEQGIRQSLDEQARLREEQIRLQSVMIEMLNAQLRGCRSRIARQTEQIEELKRLIRVRDDLLYLRNEPASGASAPDGGPWRWLARLVPGSKRG